MVGLFTSLNHFFFFFFQAEDGIRDFHVTGVQTCALPISTWCADADRLAQRGTTAAPPAAGRPRCDYRGSCRAPPSCAGAPAGARRHELHGGPENREHLVPVALVEPDGLAAH